MDKKSGQRWAKVVKGSQKCQKQPKNSGQQWPLATQKRTRVGKTEWPKLGEMFFLHFMVELCALFLLAPPPKADYLLAVPTRVHLGRPGPPGHRNGSQLQILVWRAGKGCLREILHLLVGPAVCRCQVVPDHHLFSDHHGDEILSFFFGDLFQFFLENMISIYFIKFWYLIKI